MVERITRNEKVAGTKCDYCGSAVHKAAGHINRARKIGASMFCDRTCFGLSRRVPKTDEERKEEKRLYDEVRRITNRDEICEKQRANYRKNRAQILSKQAEYRKKRMPAHVEYCRQPWYRAKKREYDKEYNAREYGEFAETYRLLLDLEREIRSRASAYERRVQNGYYKRNAQARRRALWQLMARI